MSDLFHVEYGHGVPVLALHGFSPDHRLMVGCLEPVFVDRPGFRRLYPDLPGMGRSSGTGVSTSDDILAAVERFIDVHIGNEPFVLVGESYGGYLARAIAHRRDVRGLALICPIGVEPVRDRRDLPEPQIIVDETGATDGMRPDLVRGFGEMAVVSTAMTAGRFVNEIAPGLDAADNDTMNRVAAAGWELSTRPEVGIFEGPTLMVTGRQDHVTGYRDVYRLLDDYPRATFAVLDSAGHNAQIERPELFNSLITDWLDRVEYANRA